MREQSEHTDYVDTWVERLPKDLAPEQLVAAFEQSFSALWRRAERTLGGVTVSAIADRVLHDASGKFPLLAALKVEGDTGVQFGELRRRVRQEDVEHLLEGMRSTLVQFITVMGNLTAQILTPALHVELSSLRIEDLGITLSTNGKHPPQGAAGPTREGLKR